MFVLYCDLEAVFSVGNVFNVTNVINVTLTLPGNLFCSRCFFSSSGSITALFFCMLQQGGDHAACR